MNTTRLLKYFCTLHFSFNHFIPHRRTGRRQLKYPHLPHTTTYRLLTYNFSYIHHLGYTYLRRRHKSWNFIVIIVVKNKVVSYTVKEKSSTEEIKLFPSKQITIILQSTCARKLRLRRLLHTQTYIFNFNMNSLQSWYSVSFSFQMNCWNMQILFLNRRKTEKLVELSERRTIERESRRETHETSQPGPTTNSIDAYI